MTDPIPSSVVELVTRHITSVGLLELLLLARRTRDRVWTVDGASQELRTSPQSAAIQLEELARRGFLRREQEGFRYVAADDLDVAVADLEHAYRTYRTRIVRLIFDD